MTSRHYSADEWLTYKLRISDTAETAEMETHLLVCDNCREIYLDLIDLSDLEQAQQHIPPDFANTLINRLEMRSSPRNIIKLPKKSVVNRKGIFAYYVTAAAVTLALMSGGVFDSMVDQSVRLSNICVTKSQRIESKVSKDWSSKILKDSSQWMQNRSFDRERNVKNAK